jgi:hypothetical protein
MEHECFGLPHGGAIFGLIIGVIILIWGLSELAIQMNWIHERPEFWFLIIIIFGVLLIAGAIYGMSRRKSP